MADEKIRILGEKCRGCTLCVKSCPFGAIAMVDGVAVIDCEACTLCGSCVSACKKFGAIEMVAEDVTIAAPEGDVWVVCEHEDGALMPVSLELLGLARNLADTRGSDVTAVIMGGGAAALGAEAGRYGADIACTVEHPDLVHYDDEPYAAVLSRLIREHAPDILLGGATAVGRALLPRVAIMLHTGLTADCTELSIDPKTGLLLQTRPAFGGNILATITCERHRPQMATVRPAVLPRPEPVENCTCRVVPVTPHPVDLQSRVSWLDFVPRGRGGIDLREAEIIVTAGYGVGGAEGVRLVADLAGALGGVLGASRPTVDAGWVEYAHQVGQTGTTVQPKLYVACGVSGAIQHIVGMQNSDTVIAINRDPEAPIFQYADVALVGDVFEIIPEILKQLAGTSNHLTDESVGHPTHPTRS